MTVESQTNRVAYTGNGTANPLAVDFPFQEQTDLVVVRTVTATGVQTTLVLNSDYSITGTADGNGFYPNGGSVVPAASIPSTETWTIYRDPEITQEVEHVDNDPLPAASIDNPLDKLTMIAQRSRDLIGRAIRIPDGDPAFNMVLPNAVARGGNFLGFAADGSLALLSAITPAGIVTGTLLTYVSQYSSLEAADSAAAGLGGALVLDKDVTLSAPVTLSAKTIIAAGGVIHFGNNDLTFADNSITAGAVQIFDCSGTGAVVGNISGPVCMDWWGTTSASTADSATADAGNAALAYVAQSDNPSGTIFCLKTDYYLSESLVKAASFDCPNIIGHKSALHYALTAAAAIQLVGTSGSICQANIQSFKFNGSATSWGIEVQGLGGVNIKDVVFNTNAWGIVCHNKNSGQFTEYCQWEDAFFSADCAQAWWFKKGSGNNSFHGCGPRKNVLVDSPVAASGPNILIDQDAFVYNAPLNFQVWVRNIVDPVIKFGGNNSRLLAYGNVTVENFSAGEVTLAGTNTSFATLVGGVEEFGGSTILGGLVLMNKQGITLSGTVPGIPKPYKLTSVLPAGGGTILIQRFTDANHIIDLQLNAANYIYKYTLKTWRDGFGGAGVTTLASEQSFNTAGYGAPTITFAANGLLSITNAGYPAATVTAVLGVTPLDGA